MACQSTPFEIEEVTRQGVNAFNNLREKISIFEHIASETRLSAMAAKVAVSNPQGDVHIKTSANQHPVRGSVP